MRIFRKTVFIFLNQGLRALCIRISRKTIISLVDLFKYFIDTFNLHKNQLNEDHLIIKNLISEDLCSVQEIDSIIIKNYLNHRFNLLGSGWISVHYGMKCMGVENISFQPIDSPHIDPDGLWLRGRIRNSFLKNSQIIWKCIDNSYKPIDWQIDFKSGYRWSESNWFKSVKFIDIEGADVKVPWELSRMQHLPILARQFTIKNISKKEKDSLVFEFRNQILDFIATNPVRHGVNWICSMDVAIRASNWLLAYDIFCSNGYEFDEDFLKHFKKSISQHGHHIFKNLEWNYGDRGNHYLTNICGLIFIGRYLNETSFGKKWLNFSIEQLILEVSHQFYEEGTHFEGSTAYHLLTCEMVLFATGLVLGMSNEELNNLEEMIKGKKRKGKNSTLKLYKLKNSKINTPFPPNYFIKLFKMANFLNQVSKSNNTFPQIGDNDSGRFFKLNPVYKRFSLKKVQKTYANKWNYEDLSDDEDYLHEELLYGCYLRDLSEVILGISDINSFDCMIMRSYLPNLCNFAILDKTCLIKPLLDRNTDSTEKFPQEMLDSLTDLKPKVFNSDSNLLDDLELIAYKSFGLYVFKSKNLYMSIRCWSGEDPYQSGHMHFDQLSMELSIESKDLIFDPGSYLYSPLPKKRWSYRSPEAHFSPFKDKNYLEMIRDDPFSSIKPTPMHVNYFGELGFYVEYDFDGSNEFFCVKVNKKNVSIFSSLNSNAIWQDPNILLSEGYGVLLNEQS